MDSASLNHAMIDDQEAQAAQAAADAARAADDQNTLTAKTKIHFFPRKEPADAGDSCFRFSIPPTGRDTYPAVLEQAKRTNVRLFH